MRLTRLTAAAAAAMSAAPTPLLLPPVTIPLVALLVLVTLGNALPCIAFPYNGFFTLFEALFMLLVCVPVMFECRFACPVAAALIGVTVTALEIPLRRLEFAFGFVAGGSGSGRATGLAGVWVTEL